MIVLKHSRLRLGAAFVLALFSTQLAATTPTTSSTMSVADFMAPSDIANIQYSPSGKYIAAVISIPETPYENAFAIFDGETGKGIRMIHSGKKALLSGYFWVTDQRLVASLAIKQNYFDTPAATGEVFGIDVDGSHSKDLFGVRRSDGEETYATASFISDRPLDDHQILIATNAFSRTPDGSYTDIQRLDVNVGRLHDMGRSPARNASLMADHASQVRVAVATTNFISASMWVRNANGEDWKLANDPEKSHVEIAPLGFNRSNDKLYVRVTHPHQPDSIELMDMATLQRQLLYQPQFASPGTLLPTADGLDYYAVVTLDGKAGLHFFDENSHEAHWTQSLQASFPGQLVTFSSFTRDGSRAVVHVRGDQNPGIYLIFDLRTMQAHPFIQANSRIHPEQLQPMEPIALKARDGLQLHGFLTLPSGSRPFPLIVLPHGGPHGVFDTWSYNSEAQLFASRGYAVLQVNYRGSGGYGGWFQHMGYKQWGLSMQDDLTDATHWATEQGYTTPGKICIVGGSYGGYAALEGVVKEPDLYRCAIGYAGVYDLRVQVDQSDTSRSTMGANYLQEALGTDRADLLARSPLGGVDHIKADVLLIHGGEDPRVPIKNFREMTAALDHAGKHYEQLVMPNEGHGFFLPEHREAAYTKMLDFLDHEIGSQATTH